MNSASIIAEGIQKTL